MRFACQSCGKAYNLPEEKIADKSNVKLKCRVCGAIVEVKRSGEVVAQILGEADGKRTRVSEAPAPLTSLTSEDGEDATQAISIGDQHLDAAGEDAAAALMGHVQSALGQRAQVPLPPPPPTGFPTPVPPPLGPPEPAFSRPEPIAPPLPGSPEAAPPPPLPQIDAHEAPMQNGSSSYAHPFGDLPHGDRASAPEAPVPHLPMAPMSAPGAVALSEPGLAAASMSEPGLAAGPPVGQAAAPANDTTLKMLAALITGILIGFILSRLLL